jgi:hypothetical protein
MRFHLETILAKNKMSVKINIEADTPPVSK